MVGAGIRANKYEISDFNISVDTSVVHQDFDTKRLVLSRYLTSVHTLLKNPGELTISVGNLDITYNGIHSVNLVGMTDLNDQKGDEIVIAHVEYQAAYIFVKEKLIKEEEK